jgi:hypothetical protein
MLFKPKTLKKASIPFCLGVKYLKTGHLCCYRFHVILLVHFVEFHPLLTQVEGAGFRAEKWDGRDRERSERERERERETRS